MDENKLPDFFLLKEAKFDEKTGNLKVLIIEEGFNVAKTRFYTAGALEKGAHLFAGKKMYKNHESDWTTRERGARDIDDWVATIISTEAGKTADNKTGIFGNVNVHSTEFRNKLKDLKEANQLNQLGVSIVAISDGERKELDGTMTNVVNEFIAARSVDFVSEPGAGGKVQTFKESKGGNEDMEIKDLTIEKLKESNPNLLTELTKGITDSIKESIKVEAADAKKKADKEAADLADKNKTKTDDEKQAETFNIREAGLDRKELVSTILSDNQLPANVKARIKESFLATDVKMSGSKLDIQATKEALGSTIDAEERYIKEFTDAKVTGGNSQTPNPEGAKIMESAQGMLDNLAGIVIKEGAE